jgi:amiloride-sensitive sodium channel
MSFEPDVYLQMRLHSPVETPKIAEFGFIISPGQEYRLAIKPTISNASSSIRRIPLKKRQCLFSDEKYLKYYRTYTERNCAMECEANYTLAMCKCVPYYLPSRSNAFS